MAESDIVLERIEIEFEESLIDLTFSYSESGGGELAPATLSTEPCVNGGIEEISRL